LFISVIKFSDGQLDDLSGISLLTTISIAVFLLAVFHSSAHFLETLLKHSGDGKEKHPSILYFFSPSMYHREIKKESLLWRCI